MCPQTVILGHIRVYGLIYPFYPAFLTLIKEAIMTNLPENDNHGSCNQFLEVVTDNGSINLIPIRYIKSIRYNPISNTIDLYFSNRMMLRNKNLDSPPELGVRKITLGGLKKQPNGEEINTYQAFCNILNQLSVIKPVDNDGKLLDMVTPNFESCQRGEDLYCGSYHEGETDAK